MNMNKVLNIIKQKRDYFYLKVFGVRKNFIMIKKNMN